MPIRVQVDPCLEVVFMEGEGSLSESDLLNAALARNADPLFIPSFRLLADYTAADLTNVSTQCMRHVAELNLFLRSSRCALIVPQPLTMGLGSVLDFYHSLERKTPYLYFRSRAEALAFLNEGMPVEKIISE